MKLQDLTGQRFGRLVVLKRAPTHEDPSGRKRTYWTCQCDCGNIKDIAATSLKNGATQSCGCLQKEKTSQNNFKDLANQRFGRLTALWPVGKKSSGTIWHCKCDCGNECDVGVSQLTTGHTQSCGCYNKDRIHETQVKDLTGQKFGKLTVLYEATEKKYGKTTWHCRCDCGQEIDATGNALQRGGIYSCGCANSKGELKIRELLDSHGITFEAQKSFPDLLSPKGNKLKFDFAIYDNDVLTCLIEYQGEQHYKALNYFENGHDNFEERQKRDVTKREYCKNHGIKLIEIPYTDFKSLNWEYLYEKIS